MKASARCSVVIVGGGAGGTLAALHLLRSGAPLDVTIVERSRRLGAGVAYGTTDVRHLLNVRCNGMSAYPDDPGNFTAWATRWGAAAGGDDFVPRRLYAAYLREQLVAAAADSPMSRLRVMHADATGVESVPTPAVLLGDGGRLVADRIVLATGNHLPTGPAGLATAGDRHIRDPWAPGWLDQLDPAAMVLLVGTGLTSIDVILSLLERGHRGSIVAVSRHGLLPTEHTTRPAPPLPPCVRPGDLAATTARGLLRTVRQAIVDADARGEDWRQVIDGLRPVTVALWRRLPVAERRRFLRHVSRRWEVVRHRVAPQTAHQLRDAITGGQLHVHAGRVIHVARTEDGVRVALCRAGTSALIDASVVVDCTGPTADPALGGDALLCDVLGDGLARRDAHALGIETTEDGAVIDRTGRHSEWLFAIGVLRRGSEWESTAVPELRGQAVALAGLLTDGRRQVAA
jgi:uncharacterized NAD(P)/FAD-binding protein YdhS